MYKTMDDNIKNKMPLVNLIYWLKSLDIEVL